MCCLIIFISFQKLVNNVTTLFEDIITRQHSVSNTLFLDLLWLLMCNSWCVIVDVWLLLFIWSWCFAIQCCSLCLLSAMSWVRDFITASTIQNKIWCFQLWTNKINSFYLYPNWAMSEVKRLFSYLEVLLVPF